MALELARKAKWAFTTRRVRRADAVALDDDVAAARSGDLLLARVERIGSHRRLQLSSGRPSELWRGDFVVAACGDRYAVDQLEGISEIDPDGCDLLAGGGVIGRALSTHDAKPAPTRLMPLGRLTNAAGAPLSLADYALPHPGEGRPETVIYVAGSGMNAGKTTAAAALIRGLAVAGFAVAGLKATGTGACGDLHAYADAGARFVADFVDDGLVSTYRQPTTRILATLEALVGHAAGAGCDVAVVEIADGVLQPETEAVLARAASAGSFDGLVFAAADALSAIGGLAALARLGIAPLALSGLVTRAPLAVREVETVTSVWTMDKERLADPAAATALLAEARIAGSGGVSELAA